MNTEELYADRQLVWENEKPAQLRHVLSKPSVLKHPDKDELISTLTGMLQRGLEIDSAISEAAEIFAPWDEEVDNDQERAAIIRDIMHWANWVYKELPYNEVDENAAFGVIPQDDDVPEDVLYEIFGTPETNADRFLGFWFGHDFDQGGQYIELRQFPAESGMPDISFHADFASVKNSTLPGWHVYFGVCPRKDSTGGKKEHVHKVPGLWIDLDVGEEGHKKQSDFTTIAEALKAIHSTLAFQPSIIVDSGHGLHCYWKFSSHYKIKDDADRAMIEAMNKGLARALGGDCTHDVSRILRLPGTYNVKNPERPKECRIYEIHEDRVYSPDDFKGYIASSLSNTQKIKNENQNQPATSSGEHDKNIQITTNLSGDSLLAKIKPSEKVVNIITTGHFDTSDYASRSERDHAVVLCLAGKGATLPEVQKIFEDFPVGDKYREKGHYGLQYLRASFDKAEGQTGFRDAADGNQCDTAYSGGPWKFNAQLYAGTILSRYDLSYKHGHGFHEYDAEHGVWIRRDDTYCNALAYRALEEHASIHYKREVLEAIKNHNNVLLPPDRTYDENPNLINTLSGMLDPVTLEIVSHDRKFYSTIQHPVRYNPDATCPMWTDEFLPSLELYNQDVLTLQQYFGYCFLCDVRFEKALILFGSGRNGKGVICNVLTDIIGPEYVINIQPSRLSEKFGAINLIGAAVNCVRDTDSTALLTSAKAMQ